ncbi:hypothetical protein CCP3SC1_1310003 [Gammaproteobacteria bacterium]
MVYCFTDNLTVHALIQRKIGWRKSGQEIFDAIRVADVKGMKSFG